MGYFFYMLKTFLYTIVEYIALIHEKILTWNDSYELYFSDKQLHFLVIGILGMAILFVVHPIFVWLARRRHVLVISWLYAFTCILVITFAIEIGQKVTNTGNMEFQDIVFGIAGFFLMFLVFAIVRDIVLRISRWLRKRR